MFNYIGTESDPAVLARIAKTLCKHARVNLQVCSGASDVDQLQKLADALKAEVCGCDRAMGKPFECKGKWICRPPRNQAG